MKKFFACVFIMMLFINGINRTDFSLLDYFDGEYTIYTEEPINENSVDVGFCYINNMKEKTVKPNLIVGESIIVKNLEVGSALRVMNAEVVKTEVLKNNSVVIYAYTKLINSQVEVENKSVNLQLVCREGDVVIGWPLILGSF